MYRLGFGNLESDLGEESVESSKGCGGHVDCRAFSLALSWSPAWFGLDAPDLFVWPALNGAFCSLSSLVQLFFASKRTRECLEPGGFLLDVRKCIGHSVARQSGPSSRYLALQIYTFIKIIGWLTVLIPIGTH